MKTSITPFLPVAQRDAHKALHYFCVECRREVLDLRGVLESSTYPYCTVCAERIKAAYDR